MIYNEFRGEKLSMLGFGTMRLPIIEGGKGADVDQEKVNEMTAYAIEHGVNYFDTARPYHEGMSEVAIGRALKAYPRDSYYLADKFPGHQVAASYNPEEVFEEQLKLCGVDYFDFYLLHNVNEFSISTYLDPRWNIIKYFDEQRKLGRIKRLGFSCHADAQHLEEFLSKVDIELEFCQIQLNYVDWTLQDAKKKCEILSAHNIPVWVMEPVRGGKLANLSEEQTSKLKELRPDESNAAWAFRFLQGVEGVTVVLSGMSNMEQMMDNIKTFEKRNTLNEKETETVMGIAEQIKASVPCTSCRYCTKGCPKQLEIPKLINLYNDYMMAKSIIISMRLETLGPDHQPKDCIGCGKCKIACPQKIDIPSLMKTMDTAFSAMPKWADVCKERDEIEKKVRDSIK